MEIEFQYFEGCPNAKETLANLESAMGTMGIDNSTLKIRLINSLQEAEEFSFQGSPTVLVNGNDVTTGSPPEGYAYTCRVYDFDGLRTGVIGEQFLVDKLTTSSK